MRTGKLMMQMVEDGCYPKCLDEGFTEVAATKGRPFVGSPLYWFMAERNCWSIVASFGLMHLAALFIIARLQSVHEVVRQVVIFSSGFMLLMLATYGLTRLLYLSPARRFERRLKDVLFALHPVESERAVHLMTLEEAKERAAQRLASIAYEILRLERAGDVGMPAAEDRRRELRERFDLFKKYGLTGDGGYEGCFNAAKQKLLEETPVSSHVMTPA